MSIRVTLHFKVKADKKKELVHFLKLNLPNVRQFPGCLYVDVLFSEDNNEMLLEEQWQSIELHKNYIAFIKDNGVLDQLNHFMVNEPLIGYFEKSDI